MEIADNVLKHYLRNVLWIGGGGCGGKTTAADKLAAKHGLIAYHADDALSTHGPMASPCGQPAMTRPFNGWERFFCRPVDEYVSWLYGACSEQFDFVVCDIIGLGVGKRIVADGCFTGSFLARVSDPSRVAFMFAEPALIRSLFFARGDKASMLGALQSLPDPAAAISNVLHVAEAHSQRLLGGATAGGFRCWTRSQDSDPDAIIAEVERHFGLE